MQLVTLTTPDNGKEPTSIANKLFVDGQLHYSKLKGMK